jgi:exosortase D (VPLPA-CTERM-specific)
MNSIPQQGKSWIFSRPTWLYLIICGCLLTWSYYGGLEELVKRWGNEPEYNHGFLIPLVTIYFIWEQRAHLQEQKLNPSWFSLFFMMVSLLLFVIGELSGLFLLIHYSIIFVLLSLSLSLLGWAGTKRILVPISLLIFAIPLPYYLEATLTTKLQLLSSKLGTDLIRFCNIPVYTEGNIVDLGVYRLEVVEACSGLTYLYPFLGFGCICAYLYHTSWWKRAFVIISTIPISILLNSFRIGITGLLVKYFGKEMAEGFIHDFEGWAVFMVCVAILFLEMWLLNLIGSSRKPFQAVFGLQAIPAKNLPLENRPISRPFLANLALIFIVAVAIKLMDTRQEIKPDRETFATFPQKINDWYGSLETLESNVLKTLGLTDYVLMNFSRNAEEAAINFYVAYYDSQRKGVSPHSPTVCIPGGGWQMSGLTQYPLPTKDILGKDLTINHAILKKGEHSELMYFWFQERGRFIADQFQMKWYLLYDALTKNRTDGALVRLITRISPGESLEVAEQRTREFTREVLPIMNRFVPD